MLLRVRITPAIGLNVREGPSTSFNKVSALSQGTEVVVNDQASDGSRKWYRLDDNNGGWWICGDYVVIVENLDPNQVPTQTPPTPPATPPSTTPPIDTAVTPPKDYAAIQAALIASGTLPPDNVFGSNLDVTSIGKNNAEQLSAITNSSNFPPLVSVNKGVNIYNYFMDHSFIENNLKKVRNNLNLIGDKGFSDMNQKLFTEFNKYKIAFPDYHLSKTFAYVFFTRPDLNLIEYQGDGIYTLLPDVEKDPTYYYLSKNNSNILLSLTRYLSADHPFHPFLSNTATSFEIADEYIKTMEHGETFTGYKVMYGKNNIESKTAGTFNVNFIDDQEFSVYKTHKAWIDYISKVYRGELKASDEYIHKKILDYACSAYYILCGPDGESILFWSKYFGVFPTNAPSSVTSWTKGNLMKIPEYSTTFAYAFKEDFSPLTLAEFNMNNTGSYLYRKVYEPTLVGTGKTFMGAPFIETNISRGSKAYEFKLKFRN